jgi:hypothetical protein
MSTAHKARPVSVWLAHHELPIYITYTVTVAVYLLVPDTLYMELAGAMATVGMMAATVGVIRHERVFCARCIAEAPTDGPAQALRSTRTLRYVHRYSRRWMGLLVGGCAVGMWWWPWLYVALWACLCGDAWAQRRHSFLRAWCPWCHPPRDDDTVCVPPVPALWRVR